MSLLRQRNKINVIDDTQDKEVVKPQFQTITVVYDFPGAFKFMERVRIDNKYFNETKLKELFDEYVTKLDSNKIRKEKSYKDNDVDRLYFEILVNPNKTIYTLIRPSSTFSADSFHEKFPLTQFIEMKRSLGNKDGGTFKKQHLDETEITSIMQQRSYELLKRMSVANGQFAVDGNTSEFVTELNNIFNTGTLSTARSEEHMSDIESSTPGNIPYSSEHVQQTSIVESPVSQQQTGPTFYYPSTPSSTNPVRGDPQMGGSAPYTPLPTTLGTPITYTTFGDENPTSTMLDNPMLMTGSQTLGIPSHVSSPGTPDTRSRISTPSIPSHISSPGSPGTQENVSPRSTPSHISTPGTPGTPSNVSPLRTTSNVSRPTTSVDRNTLSTEELINMRIIEENNRRGTGTGGQIPTEQPAGVVQNVSPMLPGISLSPTATTIGKEQSHHVDSSIVNPNPTPVVDMFDPESEQNKFLLEWDMYETSLVVGDENSTSTILHTQTVGQTPGTSTIPTQQKSPRDDSTDSNSDSYADISFSPYPVGRRHLDSSNSTPMEQENPDQQASPLPGGGLPDPDDFDRVHRLNPVNPVPMQEEHSVGNPDQQASPLPGGGLPDPDDFDRVHRLNPVNPVPMQEYHIEGPEQLTVIEQRIVELERDADTFPLTEEQVRRVVVRRQGNVLINLNDAHDIIMGNIGLDLHLIERINVDLPREMIQPMNELINRINTVIQPFGLSVISTVPQYKKYHFMYLYCILIKLLFYPKATAVIDFLGGFRNPPVYFKSQLKTMIYLLTDLNMLQTSYARFSVVPYYLSFARFRVESDEYIDFVEKCMTVVTRIYKFHLYACSQIQKNLIHIYHYVDNMPENNQLLIELKRPATEVVVFAGSITNIIQRWLDTLNQRPLMSEYLAARNFAMFFMVHNPLPRQEEGIVETRNTFNTNFARTIQNFKTSVVQLFKKKLSVPVHANEKLKKDYKNLNDIRTAGIQENEEVDNAIEIISKRLLPVYGRTLTGTNFVSTPTTQTFTQFKKTRNQFMNDDVFNAMMGLIQLGERPVEEVQRIQPFGQALETVVLDRDRPLATDEELPSMAAQLRQTPMGDGRIGSSTSHPSPRPDNLIQAKRSNKTEKLSIEEQREILRKNLTALLF